MKRVLSVLVCAVMLCSTFAGLNVTSSASTLPASGSCGENVTYTFDEETGLLTISGTGDMRVEAFSYKRDIKSVVIHSGVTNISSYAFCYCTYLESIVFPDTVTTIGSYTFYGCENLKEISIPAGVSLIGSRAFYNCRQLNKIDLPQTITDIGDEAFSGCSFASFNIANIELWCKIRFGNYAANPLYFAENVFIQDKPVVDLVIPEGVENIGDYAFCGFRGLKSVMFAGSVKSLGIYAFYHCEDLQAVTIPDNITKIANRSFYQCTALEEVTIGQGVSDFGLETFSGCRNLSSVNYSGSLEQWFFITNINYSKVLSNCKRLTINGQDTNEIKSLNISHCEKVNAYSCALFSNLEKVSISGAVKYIDNLAFYGCKTLKSVSIGKEVETVSANSFKDCKQLEKLTLSSDIKINQKEIIYEYDYDFGSGQWDKGWYYSFTQDIKSKALSGCPIKSISFSNAPKQLNNTFNFLYCAETLSTFEVPNGVKYIGDSTFKECKNLKYVTIPKSVSRIEYNAFSGCTNVTIKGYKGSFAETYCKQTGIPFKALTDVTTRKVTGFKCAARTVRAQTVTWNNVKTAAGYQVQISTKDGKKWAAYATLGAGITKYTFKNLAAGNNYKFRVRYFVKDSRGKVTYSAWSTTLNSPTLPSATSLTKVNAGKRAFTAQWKRQAVTGYQVQYSTNAKFTNAKKVTVRSVKTLKTTVKKLSAKKTYYVRIRTYKTISKVHYFSTWSKAVKVKTK